MVRCTQSVSHRILCVTTYAENAVLADQLDLAVADAALGIALAIGFDVA
jgi:hypothetical protein